MRYKIFLLALTFGMLSLTPNLATATHPVRRLDYEFADSSHLHVTGGLAGINEKLGIEGTIAVVLEVPHDEPRPTIHPTESSFHRTERYTPNS